jgi:hypothetical protein
VREHETEPFMEQLLDTGIFGRRDEHGNAFLDKDGRDMSRSAGKHRFTARNQRPALGAGTRGPAARPARARPLVHANAPSHTQRTF